MSSMLDMIPRPRVTYSQGLTVHDADFMDKHIRELERQDFLLEFDTVREGVLAAAMMSDFVQTVSIAGEVACIFGVTHPQHISEGVIVQAPWLVLTETAEKKNRFTVLREAQRWWKFNRNRWAVLYNWVPTNDVPAQDFLEFIGFEVYRDRPHKRGGGEYFAFKWEKQ